MGAPSPPPHDRRGPPTGPLLMVVNRGARVISDVKCGVWRAGLCDPPVRPSPVPSPPTPPACSRGPRGWAKSATSRHCPPHPRLQSSGAPAGPALCPSLSFPTRRADGGLRGSRQRGDVIGARGSQPSPPQARWPAPRSPRGAGASPPPWPASQARPALVARRQEGGGERFREAGPGSAGPDKGPHGPRHVRLLSRLRRPFLPGPAALPSPAPPQGQEESEARWQPQAPFARVASARSRSRTRKRSGESAPHPPARPGQCSCGLRLRR